MPLQNIVNIIRQARDEKNAVPLFDAFDSYSVDGIMNAAEETRSPVIVAMYDSAMESPNAPDLAVYIASRANRSPVPVALSLDHGKDLNQVRKALSLGFTGVMFDGSRLPFGENVCITKDAAASAHDAGAFVEGELGVVGSGSDYQNEERSASLTDPEVAGEFAKATGVDLLAVAIGTAHGVYQGEPALDLTRLEAIASKVDLPLVLHGGTGLREEQFRAAIARGIAKINVATDLYLSAGVKMAEVGRENPSYWAIRSAAIDTIQGRCAFYMELFGAAGRGAESRDLDHDAR